MLLCATLAVVSLPVVAAAFYGIRLQGSFVLFWLVYYMTLCVGIGELAGSTAQFSLTTSYMRMCVTSILRMLTYRLPVHTAVALAACPHYLWLCLLLCCPCRM